MFMFVIELMITETCNIDVELIQREDHLIPLENIGKNGGGKTIPRKQEYRIGILLPQLFYLGLEINNTSEFPLRLNIINIIEMNYRYKRLMLFFHFVF